MCYYCTFHIGNSSLKALYFCIICTIFAVSSVLACCCSGNWEVWRSVSTAPVWVHWYWSSDQSTENNWCTSVAYNMYVWSYFLFPLSLWQSKGAALTVNIFHLDWPENGIPDTTFQLSDVLEKVKVPQEISPLLLSVSGYGT